MGKLRCCILEDVKKGSWTAQEDQKLIAYVLKHGEGGWRSLPLKAGLQRCGKSCRLRWVNYLRSGIKRGSFTPEEEETIIKLHAQLGNRWAAIAKQLPNRTDNEIKNHWNAHIKKRLLENGTEPVTHNPAMPCGDGQSAHEQPPLSKPKRSSVAELLNKLATRVTTVQSLHLIKSRLDFGPSKPPSDGDDRDGHPVDVKDYSYFSDSTSDGQELSDLPQKSGLSAAAGQVMNQQMSSPPEWAEQLPGTPASEDGFSYRFCVCDVGSPSLWDFEFAKDLFGSSEGEEEGGACN